MKGFMFFVSVTYALVGSDPAWADTDDMIGTSMVSDYWIPNGSASSADIRTAYFFNELSSGPRRRGERTEGNRCRAIPSDPHKPELCSAHEEAYIEGFRDALNGRRFRNTPPYQVSCWRRNDENNPTDPSRRSCQSYRVEGAHPDALSCCLRGYDQGLPRLLSHIRRNREATALGSQRVRSAPERVGNVDCVESANQGYAAGEQFCLSLRDPGSATCPAVSERISHLGCYHAAIQAKLVECSANMNQVAQAWLRQSGLSSRRPANAELELVGPSRERIRMPGSSVGEARDGCTQSSPTGSCR